MKLTGTRVTSHTCSTGRRPWNGNRRSNRVLSKALAKDPSERTASARDFERALLEARQASVTPNEKMRILIADDDPDFCMLAADTLAYAFPKASKKLAPTIPKLQALRERVRERPRPVGCPAGRAPRSIPSLPWGWRPAVVFAPPESGSSARTRRAG